MSVAKGAGVVSTATSRPQAVPSHGAASETPGPSSLPKVAFENEEYRVVMCEVPDQYGILELIPRIEMADGRDLLGQMRWRYLEDKDDRWGKTILIKVLKSVVQHKYGKS